MILLSKLPVGVVGPYGRGEVVSVGRGGPSVVVHEVVVEVVKVVYRRMLIWRRGGHASSRLAHVPVGQIRRPREGRRDCRGPVHRTRGPVGHADAARTGGVALVAVAVVMRGCFAPRWGAPATVDLHVFSQAGRVRVRLVATWYSAVVRLVWSVDVTVLLAVGTVGETSVAALILAFEGFLTWNNN